MYRYDPRKAFNGEAQTETDFVDYCEFAEVVEIQTHRTNTQLLNGKAQLIFLVPPELRGFVSVDFELFNNKSQKISNEYIYCQTNGKMLTPAHIEIENPYVESDEDIHQRTTMPDTFVESHELVEVVDPRIDAAVPPPIPASDVKEEEKPKDAGEPEVAPAPPVNPSDIPPTDVSSTESVNIPPTVETDTFKASSWYLPALVMALIMVFGVAFFYIIYIAVTDWPDEETQVAMIDDEEEVVGLIQPPMDVPDTQNSEEEIAESVPSVISPVPVRDLEVVSLAMEESDENPVPVVVECPSLYDAMREKTESYIHAVSALNAEVDLTASQRDDAMRKLESCERELEIAAALASQPADAPVIIVDAKKEEIIPLRFPPRAVKPKGEPLVLEDLEGIPTFDTMTMSEKRIFLRLHNKTVNK